MQYDGWTGIGVLPCMHSGVQIKFTHMHKLLLFHTLTHSLTHSVVYYRITLIMRVLWVAKWALASSGAQHQQCRGCGSKQKKPLSFQQNTTQPPTTPWTVGPRRHWNTQRCETSISIFNAGVENKLIPRRRPRSVQHPRKDRDFSGAHEVFMKYLHSQIHHGWMVCFSPPSRSPTWRPLIVAGWRASLCTLCNLSGFHRANGERKAINIHPPLIAAL